MKQIFLALITLLPSKMTLANSELPEIKEIYLSDAAYPAPLSISQSEYIELGSGTTLNDGWFSHIHFDEETRDEIISSLNVKSADLVENHYYKYCWPLQGKEEFKFEYIQVATYKVDDKYAVNGTRYHHKDRKFTINKSLGHELDNLSRGY